MNNFIKTKSHHKVKNIDIWLVKPTEKLDYSTYKNVEKQVKIIGGYYSKFTHSFVFEKEPSEEQLNEIFTGVKGQDTIQQEAGVPSQKIAKIQMDTQGSSSRVDRRTLRSEYEAGKLLVARYKYFNGMTDSHDYLKESEKNWSDKDEGFIREFNYSSSPYISGKTIIFGDYEVKYKDDIIHPEPIKKARQISTNFYVVTEDAKGSNERFKLTTFDNNRDDIEEGERVIMSIYGRKLFGVVIKKEVRYYTISSYMLSGSNRNVETKKSVYYTVKTDDGVTHTMATFDVDRNNEYKSHKTIPAIKDTDGVLKLPEAVWNNIKSDINSINHLKRQMAGRKKLEYKIQDQKAIYRHQIRLFGLFRIWLEWEFLNMEASREITGETADEQTNRINKWESEYSVKVDKPVPATNGLTLKLAKLNQLI